MSFNSIIKNDFKIRYNIDCKLNFSDRTYLNIPKSVLISKENTALIIDSMEFLYGDSKNILSVLFNRKHIKVSLSDKYFENLCERNHIVSFRKNLLTKFEEYAKINYDSVSSKYSRYKIRAVLVKDFVDENFKNQNRNTVLYMIYRKDINKYNDIVEKQGENK